MVFGEQGEVQNEEKNAKKKLYRAPSPRITGTTYQSILKARVDFLP